MITIYRLISPNGKNYVGQTSHLHDRFSCYSRLKCKGQTKLYNSILKYKWNNFTTEVLEYVPDEFADEYERHYIKVFKCCESGLNIDIGGNGGKTHSESTKLKIGLANKGRVFTDVHRLNMSLAQKGKVASKETRLKMGKAHKWRRRTGASLLLSIYKIEHGVTE